MALRRSTLLLLGALLALFGVPASALAAVPPTNTTPTPPAGGWLTAPTTVTLGGTDSDGGPVTMEWQLGARRDHQRGATARCPDPRFRQLQLKTRAPTARAGLAAASPTRSGSTPSPADRRHRSRNDLLAGRPWPTRRQRRRPHLRRRQVPVPARRQPGPPTVGPGGSTVPVTDGGAHARDAGVRRGRQRVGLDAHTVRIDSTSFPSTPRRSPAVGRPRRSSST